MGEGKIIEQNSSTEEDEHFHYTQKPETTAYIPHLRQKNYSNIVVIHVISIKPDLIKFVNGECTSTTDTSRGKEGDGSDNGAVRVLQLDGGVHGGVQ